MSILLVPLLNKNVLKLGYNFIDIHLSIPDSQMGPLESLGVCWVLCQMVLVIQYIHS